MCVLVVICFLTVVETIALQVGHVTIQLSGPSIVPETKKQNIKFTLLVLVVITIFTTFNPHYRQDKYANSDQDPVSKDTQQNIIRNEVLIPILTVVEPDPLQVGKVIQQLYGLDIVPETKQRNINMTIIRAKVLIPILTVFESVYYRQDK